jgi:hypothetical protein
MQLLRLGLNIIMTLLLTSYLEVMNRAKNEYVPDRQRNQPDLNRVKHEYSAEVW